MDTREAGQRPGLVIFTGSLCESYTHGTAIKRLQFQKDISKEMESEGSFPKAQKSTETARDKCKEGHKGSLEK